MSEPSNKRAITVLDYSSASPQREFSSFADGTRFGSGDETRLLLDVLPKELADRALHELQSQVVWCTMMNRGGDVPRLVSMQGDLIDGCEPVYRHPADEQPQMVSWTPISDELRRAVEAALSQRVNHALIQWYRSGRDWISEHSDKTLDVAPKSVICNLSIGATRVMLLKSKDRDVSQRRLQRIDLPHNSLFVLGLDTNRQWRHEIKLDKRDIRFKRPDEIRDAGHRISLTFRLIHTFRRLSDGRLFGGGARVKSLEQLADSALVDDAQEMLHAFSAENHNADFDWNTHYGAGFDALNFKVFNQQTQQLREDDARDSIASVGFRHLDVGLAEDNDENDEE